MCLYLKDLWKYWKYEIYKSRNGEMANNKGNLKIKGTANILGIWCNQNSAQFLVRSEFLFKFNFRLYKCWNITVLGSYSVSLNTIQFRHLFKKLQEKHQNFNIPCCVWKSGVYSYVTLYIFTLVFGNLEFIR